MGQRVTSTDRDRRDPLRFVDPLDPWPVTRWPIVISETYTHTNVCKRVVICVVFKGLFGSKCFFLPFPLWRHWYPICYYRHMVSHYVNSHISTQHRAPVLLLRELLFVRERVLSCPLLLSDDIEMFVDDFIRISWRELIITTTTIIRRTRSKVHSSLIFVLFCTV